MLLGILGSVGSLWGDTGPPPPIKSEAEEQEEQQERDSLIRGIYFLDPRRGFAVSQGGVLLTTEDGGSSWRQERLPQLDDVWQVIFRDGMTGWIIAGYSAYHTEDGGRTWVRQRLGRPVYPYFRRLRFVTPQVAWLVGKDVYVSRDGGTTWTSRRPFGTVDLYDIACFTADECIAVGDYDAVLTTTDGGQSWARRAFPILGSHNVRRVQITSDGTAWALADASRSVYLVRSTDRGQTWTVVAKGFPVDGFHNFLFLNGKHGMFSGTGLYRTADRGGSFQEVRGPHEGFALTTIFFLNEKLGWAAGQFQVISHTQDGGQTWTLQHKEAPIRRP